MSLGEKLKNNIKILKDVNAKKYKIEQKKEIEIARLFFENIKNEVIRKIEQKKTTIEFKWNPCHEMICQCSIFEKWCNDNQLKVIKPGNPIDNEYIIITPL